MELGFIFCLCIQNIDLKSIFKFMLTSEMTFFTNNIISHLIIHIFSLNDI